MAISKKDISEMLMGKLYYQNGDHYIPAMDILADHPLIESLLEFQDKATLLNKMKVKLKIDLETKTQISRTLIRPRKDLRAGERIKGEIEYIKGLLDFIDIMTEMNEDVADLVID